MRSDGAVNVAVDVCKVIEVPVSILDVKSPVHENERLLPASLEGLLRIGLLLLAELNHQAALFFFTSFSVQIFVPVKQLASEAKFRAWHHAGQSKINIPYANDWVLVIVGLQFGWGVTLFRNVCSGPQVRQSKLRDVLSSNGLALAYRFQLYCFGSWSAFHHTASAWRRTMLQTSRHNVLGHSFVSANPLCWQQQVLFEHL